MNRTVKNIIALVLSAIMLCASAVPSFAVSRDEWDTVMASADAKAGIVIFPGSDESERNFSWYTDAENTPSVLVSESADMAAASEFTGYSVKATEGDFANKVTVTDLAFDTTYYYQCVSGDFTSEVYSFTTDEETSFSAVYLTDIHITADSEESPTSIADTSFRLNETLEAALAKNNGISLLLSAGDQATDGLESEYRGFSMSPVLRSITVATSIGNHDKKGAEYKTFTNMPNEYDAVISQYIGDNYWFVKGDVLFLMPDTNCPSANDHYNFVKEAVAANPDVKWKVLVAHHDLYSGRIESRESENRLLRLMWAPIIDEFGVDLVLLGHSHYYTVSNVLNNGRTVAPFSYDMIDNAGTVYMVSCSLGRPRGDDDIGLNDQIGFAYLTQNAVYNVLDFSEDKITVSSYELGADEAFNSYSITKTTDEGGHTYETNILKEAFNKLVRTIGTIAAVFYNIGRYSDLTEDGFDVSFIDCIFGR